MGEHHRNGIAKANAVPQRQINYLKLADGVGLLGAGLGQAVDETGVMRFCIIAKVARISELVPITNVVDLTLAEICAISMETLTEKAKAALDEAEKPKPETIA